MPFKEIALTKGKVTIVDESDYDWLSQWKWCYGNGYAVRNACIDGRQVKRLYMHRLIVGTSADMDTDHINGNKLDNRRCNLRITTRSQNSMNQRPQTGRSSKYKGVSWYRAYRKWTAYVCINGKKKHLGYFDNEAEAADTYNQAATKLHGEFARINVVD